MSGADEHVVEVGPADDLWEGEMTDVALPGGETYVVLNIEGQLVAYEGQCPHQATELGEMGYFDGEKLVCGAHMWEFDARTGQGINPSTSCLVPVPVEERDGMIVLLPACRVGAHSGEGGAS